MSDNLFNGCVCVREPRTLEEWKDLIERLDAGKVEYATENTVKRLAKVLDVSPKDISFK